MLFGWFFPLYNLCEISISSFGIGTSSRSPSLITTSSVAVYRFSGIPCISSECLRVYCSTSSCWPYTTRWFHAPGCRLLPSTSSTTFSAPHFRCAPFLKQSSKSLFPLNFSWRRTSAPWFQPPFVGSRCAFLAFAELLPANLLTLLTLNRKRKKG